MKKKYSVEKLKNGMKFRTDVYIDSKNLLVPALIPLKQKDIDSLKKWGISHVYTESSPMEETVDSGLLGDIEISDIVSPDFDGDKELNKFYESMLQRLLNVFEQVMTRKKPDSKIIDEIVHDILKIIREDSSVVTATVLRETKDGFNSVRGGVNTAIVAVVMGIALKLPVYKLSYIATGALLHDTGMLKLPEHIIKKNGDLSENDLRLMHTHPLLSYKIITKDFFYPEETGIIALQHHERWDGNGYPGKIAGKNIDYLSRIVSIADAFEAMVSEKPYRNSMIGYQAIKNLLSDNGRRFDPQILKEFIKCMGLYPIGSLVLLNNSVIAMVLETNQESPIRPKLRLIMDEYGKKYQNNNIVNLADERKLFIVRAIDPKEFQGS